MNDVMQMIGKLRNEAIGRCRARALRAAEKTKYDQQEHYVEKSPSSAGITAHLKERRGL
jgi:hypothetical protein